MSAGRGGGAPHRAGVAALLGLPNAGKSTLFNRLIGEKLAIVTPKPQTTRGRMLGISSLPDAQILWLDTPGLFEGARALERSMAGQVEEAARDCDVAIWLADPREALSAPALALLARLADARTPLLLVASKRDLPGAAEAAWPPPAAPAAALPLGVSARNGAGIDALLAAVVARLPESPPLYDPEQLSDRPLRFLAAERIREAAFLELAQELPYRLAVEVTDFDERDPALVRIRAELIVERESQRRIAIGHGAAVVKQIGMRARAEIEALLGTRVHLELWVRVEANWSRNPARVKAFGYA